MSLRAPVFFGVVLAVGMIALDRAAAPRPAPRGRWRLPKPGELPQAVAVRSNVMLGEQLKPRPPGSWKVGREVIETYQGKRYQYVDETHNDGPDGPIPVDHYGITVYIWEPLS